MKPSKAQLDVLRGLDTCDGKRPKYMYGIWKGCSYRFQKLCDPLFAAGLLRKGRIGEFRISDAGCAILRERECQTK